MREFFNGWRRKVGMMTLVMACVAMAGWLNSRSKLHALQWMDGETGYRITSEDGLLQLHIARPVDGADISFYYSRSRWWSRTIENPSGKFWSRVFRWSRSTPGKFPAHSLIIEIPYWSITIPLTLLSTFLLLSKPRPAKKAETSPDTAI